MATSDKQPVVQSPVTAPASAINDTATHASVTFPSPWTSRVQTPIKRVPKGDISAYANDMPTNWGGPQR